jgi:hypothetical protein
MIIYSANIGGKDHFMQPLAKHKGVEFVYFVDNLDDWQYRDQIQDSIWDVREIPRKYDNGMMDAKWYKMHPHLLFPGENTVWIDGQWRSRWRLPRRIFKRDTDVIVYRHEQRICLFKEAKFCMKHKVGNRKDIRRQIEAYKKDGMPEDFGLFQGNVIYRKPEAKVFNEKWWEQVNKRSTRDQISMPYVFWKEDISFMGLSAKARAPFFAKGMGGRHLFHGVRKYEPRSTD